MKVPIKGRILLSIISYTGKSVDELQIEFPDIKKWLDNTDSPTLQEVDRLITLATNLPVGFLFLDSPCYYNFDAQAVVDLKELTEVLKKLTGKIEGLLTLLTPSKSIKEGKIIDFPPFNSI